MRHTTRKAPHRLHLLCLAKLLLARRERLLGPPPLASALAVAKLALDRGHQARELALEHIVVGARAHGLYSHLFADRSGYDDEGKVQVKFLGDGQGAQTAESGQRPIARDEVPGSCGEGDAHRGLVLDALRIDGTPQPLERFQEQFHIGRRVLDDQDAERPPGLYVPPANAVTMRMQSGPHHDPVEGGDSFMTSQKRPSVLAVSANSTKSTGFRT